VFEKKEKSEQREINHKRGTPHYIAEKFLEFCESEQFRPIDILIGLDVAKFQATKAYMALTEGK
jgi:hypothetical protein